MKGIKEIVVRLAELKRDCMSQDQTNVADTLNRVAELIDVVADLALAITADNPGPCPAVGPSELPELPRGSANG